MKKKDDLYELVQSLTKSEKRYFKLAASTQKGDKKYIKLFDLLSKQDSYNEKDLQKKMGPGITPNQFNFTRNYLYNSILGNLKLFHDKSDFSRVKDMLVQVKILYDKGLFDQATKIHLKAKRLAEDNSDFVSLIELSEWQKKLLAKNLSQKDYGNKLNELIEEQKQFLEKYLQVSESEFIFSKIQLLFNKFRHPRSEEQLEAYNQLLSNPLFKLLDNGTELPIEARIFLLKSRIIYYTGLFQHKKEFLSAKKLLEVFDDNKKLIQKNPGQYINALSLFLRGCSYLNDKESFKKTLNKLHELKENIPANKVNKSFLASLFFESCYNRFFFFEYNFEMEEAAEMIPEVEEGLKTYENQLNNFEKIYLTYSISLACFGIGNFDDSLDWFNYIMDNFKESEVSVIDLRVRLLTLIGHYELGNERLLEYLIISTYRYLVRKRKMYNYESAVIRFIRKLSNVKNREEIESLFKVLLEELQKIIEDPYEFAACSWLVYWLEAKSEKMPLKNLFELKALDMQGLRPGAAV